MAVKQKEAFIVICVATVMSRIHCTYLLLLLFKYKEKKMYTEISCKDYCIKKCIVSTVLSLYYINFSVCLVSTVHCNNRLSVHCINFLCIVSTVCVYCVNCLYCINGVFVLYQLSVCIVSTGYCVNCLSVYASTFYVLYELSVCVLYQLSVYCINCGFLRFFPAR